MSMFGSMVTVAELAALLLSVPVMAVSAPSQGDPATDDLEKLRDMLKRPGADGRQARERAVERLLAMPDAEAHRILSQTLAKGEDPDALRLTIVQALGRHLLQSDSMQFGGAATEARRQIFTYYLGTLCDWWRAGTAVPEALREAARDTLLRVSPVELEKAARLLLGANNADATALFACIADLQNLYLGQVLAEHVEAADPTTRDAARSSLRLLTFRDRAFVTQAEFADWFVKHDEPYVNLAERAARMGGQRMAELVARFEQERMRRAGDVVGAYADATPGINWEAIQKELLVPEAAVVDHCLTVLRDTLTEVLPGPSSAPRQLFCRSLLERWKVTTEPARRSLLLEVAAYTARPDEAELATEIQAGLLSQLQGETAGEQVAALRGLRRFPSVENRAVIVRFAQAAVARGAVASDEIDTAVGTLAARNPRWFAPGAEDPDKAEWVGMIRSICERPDLARLRDKTLALALTEDAKNQKVPEVFGLLLAFTQDAGQDSYFRETCVIRLQGWDYPAGDEARVLALHKLLEDPEAQLRQQAAKSLAKLVRSEDPRRNDWLRSTITALRGRLAVEPARGVLNALVECMVSCGSEPQMPEISIGALNLVLADINTPVPAEQQFRVEPLLGALVAIAGSANAGNGQWLGACEQLLSRKKRDSLRHLLYKRHAARELAKDVASDNTTDANRARLAMQFLIRTALLKDAGVAWSSTDDLRDEANAVHIAFQSLDKVEAPLQLDESVHRVLRLEVALVYGAYAMVVDKAAAWLAANDPGPAPGGAARVPFTPEQKDFIRLMAAEAQLGLTKPDLAKKALDERDPNRPLDARALAVYDRVARALVRVDANGALLLFDRARKATVVEDPMFRQRLIDWATTRVQVDPQSKAQVWAEVQQHAPMFDAQDCPTNLREAFQGLRGDN